MYQRIEGKVFLPHGDTRGGESHNKRAFPLKAHGANVDRFRDAGQ